MIASAFYVIEWLQVTQMILTLALCALVYFLIKDRSTVRLLTFHLHLKRRAAAEAFATARMGLAHATEYEHDEEAELFANIIASTEEALEITDYDPLMSMVK